MKKLWMKIKELWVWFTDKEVLEAINEDRPYEEVKAIVYRKVHKNDNQSRNS